MSIRNNSIEKQGQSGNRGGYRYRVLGSGYVRFHFDSNIPLPNADYQHWHRDSQLLFPKLMTPAFQVHEGNGSFEVIPCTQYVADEDLQSELDDVLGPGVNRRTQYHPIRLNLKKGSLWVQDGRAYHRGTPNRSDRPRDELCMAFCRPWVFNNWLHEYTESHLPRKLWDGLSSHAQHVLRWQRVKKP